jgi:4-hydroxy-2-oxoheptanedioate aldolase
MQFPDAFDRCRKNKQPAFCYFCVVNDPTALELWLKNSGLDVLVTDLQHATISAEASIHLLRAAQSVRPDIFPMTRLPNHDSYWIEQSLDAGYLGVIPPMVESAEQARQLVEKTFYPPLGRRSMAGSIRAAMYDDYVKRANDHVVLMPLIESKAGLDNLEAIADVEGISGLLLGPADLGLSCGWTGDNWANPEFVAAVERLVKACHSRGKIAAINIGSGHDRCVELGFDFIGLYSDLVYLRVNFAQFAADQLKALRKS